jgi:hypothetical protein
VNCSCINSTAYCGVYCVSCALKGSLSVCSLCIEGTILSNGFCVPCQAGCAVCSNANISLCLVCAAGYYFNQTGGCSQCTAPKCLTCSSLGCTSCQKGYIFNSTFDCVPACQFPCATCSTNDTSFCFTCAYGYKLNTFLNNACFQSNSFTLSTGVNYCPPGYDPINNSTMIAIIQYCQPCGIYCATCVPQAPFNNCTSCFNGTYASNWTCVPCPADCSNCYSENICFNCQQGFIPFIAPSLTASSPQPVLCVACLPPCINCIGSISNCLSCATNFTLQGTQCVSSFNYQIQAQLNANPKTFNQNYLNFLTQIANPINASLH